MVLKELILTVCTLGGCGGLKELKELICNSFYFGRVWCKCKTYMALKKIRGLWTYGGVGGI